METSEPAIATRVTFKPALGRIVQYMRHGSPDGTHKPEPSPAMITQVFENDECQLTIFNPTGMYMARIKYSEVPQPGCWSAPDFLRSK